MLEETIYLDYNATTQAAPEVVEVMLPWLAVPSNASSPHRYGRLAAGAVADARSTIADVVGARPNELTFTSGATESNNLAILGVAASADRQRRHIISVQTEHKAVLGPLELLRAQGWRVTLVSVGPGGLLDRAHFDEALTEDVALVSVHFANNELGTIQPLSYVSDAAHSVGAFVHTDATQALGKIPVDLAALGVDFASFSSHKVYGPQGIGFLFARRGARWSPLWAGGGQEQGLRPGTEDVASVVGLGVACRLAVERLFEFQERATRQTGNLLAALRDQVGGVESVVPEDVPRLPNTLNVRCMGVDAEALIAQASGVAFSSGSACSSRVPEPSHVLAAVLGSSSAAAECIRLSTGRTTEDEDIVSAAAQLSEAIVRIRDLVANEAR